MKQTKYPVTINFSQHPEDVIGQITFNETAYAEIFYKNPDKFEFAVGYSVDKNGKKELVEVSLIPKQQKSPETVKQL